MSTTASIPKPPKVRASFRVGVVGHRPNRLKAANEETLRGLLREALEHLKTSTERFCEQHKDLYSEERPIFRAVSPLAEGTDRMFADEAITLGYELLCPMPFPQAEYEKDFAPDKALSPKSVEQFQQILTRAQAGPGLATFEIDGSRATEGESYGAAGRIVLNQSDLLIVVWDGAPAAGLGGTVQTLREALAYDVPVLWVDAQAPHPWQILSKPDDLACLVQGTRCTPQPPEKDLGKAMTKIVTHALQPPKIEPSDHGHDAQKVDLREEFFNETKPSFNIAFPWKLFRNALGSGTFSFPSLGVPDFEETVKSDWPDDAPGSGGWVNQRLRRHYAWPDKLADLYADRYRSTYLFCFMLGTLAVFMALLPWGLSWHEHQVHLKCLWVEAITVAAILFLVRSSKSGHWHERWMDYRLVAELVRQIRFLIPLGGGRPFPRMPTHLHGYGNPVNEWTYWHVRAIERAVGLPAAKLTPTVLREALGYMQSVVQNQSGFHASTAKRCEKIEHRLHWVGVMCFMVTAAAIGSHIVLRYIPTEHPHDQEGLFNIITYLCAFLPALGAATAAINNQGEFSRIAKRSEAMHSHLVQLDEDITKLLNPNTPPTSQQTITLARRVAQLMVDEVLDWRVVFIDRPAELPA